MIKDGVGPLDTFGEGMDAHSRRCARSDCPYPEGGEAAERWLAGWDHQELGEGDVSPARE